MELIFTLILLIGFGINSHRFDSKKYEQPKQSITSLVTQEVQQKIDARISNKQVTHSGNTQSESEMSELKEFSQKPSNDASPKGKYISVRITDAINRTG